MQIKKPLTDEAVIELITNQLKKVTERYSYQYHSAEEMLGVLTEEYHEVIDEVRAGKGHITSAVLGELIDLAVVCVRGARPYMHGGAKQYEKSTEYGKI